VPGDQRRHPVSQQIAARFLEMWSTGGSSIAAEILSPDWVDHAHPEVTSRLPSNWASSNSGRLSRICGSISRPSSVTVT
jgi:hypothetical protein